MDNLHILLRRNGLHAPNHTPADGLQYKTIHNIDIQKQRRLKRIPCGPCGNVHDYVPFYFGYLTPMLLQLKSGRVEGYNEGQAPLLYLVSSVKRVVASGATYVFSDGHGIAVYTQWYDNLADLDKVDWEMVSQRYWADNVDDMDRQRRKQAEFLVHRFCDWKLIDKIVVYNDRMKERVEQILNKFSSGLRRPVYIEAGWYYY